MTLKISSYILCFLLSLVSTCFSANIDVKDFSSGAYSGVSSFNSRIGAVNPQTNDYTWAQINKSVSTIADIMTRSHTLLTDIGTNTHAQIDSHLANTSNPHSVTKAQVGLGNVDNTSDVNKPVSTAQQSALDLKENPLTFSAPLSRSVNTISVILADSTHNGYLSFADWNTFNGKLTPNVAIIGATKTKITYDINGLVTAGVDATTADIADSTNRRYCTDAQKVVIGNTSGTNTGDNATNSQYSGLAASKADVGQTMYIGTTPVTINRGSAALTLAGITLTTPDIGTPTAGNLANCTFPTLNQNTTGTASNITGLLPLANIVLGLADQKLFTNAGATAAEWGVGIKIGTFTRNLTLAPGTQSIVGVTFKPSHVIFLASPGGGTYKISVGIDNGINAYSIISIVNGSSPWSVDSVDSIYIGTSGVSGSKAHITSKDADGYTLTWSNDGAGDTSTVTVFYMAFR